MYLPRISAVASALLAGLVLAALGTGGLVWLAGRSVRLGDLLAARPLEAGALLAVAVVGWLLLLVGLALYVFLPTRSPEGAARGYASYRTMLATLAVAAIPANLVALAYQALVARPRGAEAPQPDAILVAVVALELSLLGALYLRIVRPGVITWQDMGLTSRKLGDRLAQGLGVGVGVILLKGVLAGALQAAGVQQTQYETYVGIRAAPLGEFAALLVAGSVLAPLAEESFFRGYVFTACSRTRGPWRAYLFSAGLFAVVHFNLPALLPILAIGLVLAFAYQRTGSVEPGMVAHGLNNALSFLAILLAPLPSG